MRYLIIVIALLAIPPAWAEITKQKYKVIKSTPTVSQSEIDNDYKEITWDALIPKDWDPAKPFRKLNLSELKDSDPRAMEVLDIMKQEWDSAPIEPSLDGKKVKIAGFVVPIEENNHAVSEFLLVPYFGACIHVPPPPANQIIHVISAKPIKNLRVMDSVWVVGQLKAARFSKQTDMGIGASGYQINSVSVTTYKEPVISITPYNPR
ncbi:MAG TPA: DUF3299 domain-containing protein [Burkholderiales bacterium]|nr:DUF3299 domain-containing protein [Burkholderiales bacterium]